ncbi:hypothetical protein [Agromyces neolithicus]|uniref:hypothetical protein n=1 Tax=Agromyces neolithicus TaxID=269420 RepID=UPI0031D37588
MRRTYAVLIACAVSVVLYRALTPRFANSAAAPGFDPLWVAPALAGGAAVGAALVVASASRTGLSAIERLGLPSPGTMSRSVANGLTWAALAMLAVHFTADAFRPVPGGHLAVGLALALAMGVCTWQLHRRAIEHEAYRTFNLVAMLLAAGSLASMSITPTGEWWVHNFSTLGTSGDFAAMCFNVAVATSGGGIAGLSALLTRGIAFGGFGIRRGARTVIRSLIGVVGFGLMGVGWVPISYAPDVHNAFALGAAAGFALLCIGAPWYAERMPRPFVWFSMTTLLLEVGAMVAYDGLHLFNLTVFEVVAFTLVFAWLIVFVAVTSAHRHEYGETDDAAPRRGIRLAQARRSRSAHSRAESSATHGVVLVRGPTCTGSRTPTRRNDGERPRCTAPRRHRSDHAREHCRRCGRDRATRRATPLRHDRRRRARGRVAIPARAGSDRVHAYDRAARVRRQRAR